jgi:hypothetical protein
VWHKFLKPVFTSVWNNTVVISGAILQRIANEAPPQTDEMYIRWTGRTGSLTTIRIVGLLIPRSIRLI